MPFQPGKIFSGMARSLPKSGAPASNKNSSLFQPFKIYEEKSFTTLVTVSIITNQTPPFSGAKTICQMTINRETIGKNMNLKTALLLVIKDVVNG
jgi:hypothetical protein